MLPGIVYAFDALLVEADVETVLIGLLVVDQVFAVFLVELGAVLDADHLVVVHSVAHVA